MGNYWWYITVLFHNSEDSLAENEEILYSAAEISGSIGTEIQEMPDSVRMRAYYRSDRELSYWRNKLLDALEQWQCFRVEDMGKMENQPWSRQSEDAFPPLAVGDGLVVLAPWHRGTEPHDRMPIYINPGSAFGTGYHESTQAALHLFERLLSRRKEASMPPPGRVIDVGAESGILSIAAAKLGAGSVYARDIDPTVIEEVNGNIGLNGVGAGRITMEVGNLLYGVDGSYDVLFANILLAPLLEMLPAVRGVLEPGGVAIFSGMTRDERDKFLPPLLAEGLLAVDELTKEDWWGVAAENPA